MLALLQGRPRPQSENGHPQVVGEGWDVLHESAGRLRLQNERLVRRREVCQAIERELMSVLGIDNYKTSALTGTVLILYNTKQLSMAQVIEILDQASRKRRRRKRKTGPTFTCQCARFRCLWRQRHNLWRRHCFRLRRSCSQ